jgi:putative flippase GtrA
MMLLYTLTATVWGTISYLFARFFAFLVLVVTHFLLYLGFSCKAGGPEKLAGLWPRPQFLNLVGADVGMPTNWSQSISSSLIHLTVLFVVGLVVAFVISFYFSASTIIYALMRDGVDGVSTDQIYIQLDEIRDDAEAAASKVHE